LKPAYYTNFGIGTDIAAPGGEALYGDGAVLSCVPANIATENGSKFTNYDFFQGTSMACPMVSGVAALGLSYAKQLGKRYSASEFSSMLLAATNSFEEFFVGRLTLTYGNGQTITFNYPNYKGKMGSGYVDAYKLLLNIDGTPYVTIKVGEDSQIDLSPYFGEDVSYMGYKGTQVDAAEATAMGLVVSGVSKGKLLVKTSASGCATVKVTMLQGGNNNYDDERPFPLEVERTFVIMSKSSVATNNGWL
jgi:subtilisin family serine protease